MYHMDEPHADPSCVALYFLDAMVARDVKVVLSGEGADEFFGGYPIYGEPLGLAPYQRIPKPLLKAAAAMARALPFNFKGKNLLQRAALSTEERYFSNMHHFTAREREAVLRADKRGAAPAPQTLTAPFYAKVRNVDDTAKMQYIDYNFWLPGDILLKADKMSMAHSLESRVPFLDKEVFALANTLPQSYKVRDRGARTKVALRTAALEVLPPAVAQRPKLGFPVPMRVWLREDRWYNHVQELFASETAATFFDTALLGELLRDHRDGKADNSRKVWLIYTFLIWYGVFFEHKYGYYA
jgi:asparagine synthase (glutamine-hydrolysing)